MRPALTTDQAFADFIRENQQRFYRLAYSYTKNSDDALDVVQEAVLKAYEKRHTLRSAAVLRTWFYRILINACVDFLRRSQRLVVTDAPPEGDSGQREPRAAEELDLREALDRLEPALKSVVLLRFFEEMKLREIAAVLRLPLSTVKSRLYRALELLRIDLDGEEGQEP